ncbi:MAG: cation transporter [Rhizobiales bacterium]|nr:cation transporter [Hyphomicrobiales bacterium]
MASHSSKKVIYAAFVGNALIAIAKFVAASITGSSAMLSEGIHSVVDCGNQLLLLFGLRMAAKDPDDEHPFGYGMELYFWTFVVAILIFALGAGFSIYEGIERVRHPEAVASPMVNYVVLSLSMIFEGVAWTVAFREFQKSRGSYGFIEAVRKSKDPTVFTVLFEDTAAMLGLAVAFAGVAGSHLLEMPVLDGYASIAIGIILAVVAVLLAIESKGLLIGEAADPSIVEGIKLIVHEDVRILRINEVLTMHLSPNEVLLNASLDFIDGLPAEEVEAAISQFELTIKDEYPSISRVFIEAQGWRAHLGEQASSKKKQSAGRKTD